MLNRWSALAVSLAAAVAIACSGAKSDPSGGVRTLGTGAAEDVGFSANGIAALRGQMRRQVDEGKLSGVVTMLARHGKIVAYDAYGKASIATGAPMGKDAIFRIHSQSKPVVAVAMMILHEEGKWKLDDPIAKFIPEFARLKVLKSVGADGKPVLEPMKRPPTMRELLSHTAGFAYGVGGDSYSDQRIFTEIWHDGKNVRMSYDEMLKTLADIPLVFQPGTDWRYSISSDIQGALIERISGMTFPAFMDARIFKPLKMVDTGFVISKEQAARIAGFYVKDEEGKLVELKPTAEWIFPIDHTKPAAPFYSGGGGLVSTASDFGRFAQMLLNGGELDGARVLSPASVDLIFSDQVPKSVTPVTRVAYGGPHQSFGFSVGILRHPEKANLKAPAGTALWGGMGGTWFMLDRKNDLFFVGMVQRAAEVPPEDNLPTVSASAVYGALVDPAK